MRELPPDWMVGPTTFRDFADRFLAGLDDLPPQPLARYEVWLAEVAAKLQLDDVLWEWHQRGGPFSSLGGLAVLKCGVVIEWWREWVS